MNKTENPLNILVAGGAGYIGSVTTAALIENGHHVTVLDNLSTGYRAAVHPEARFFEGDITDKTIIETICRSGIDVAMHFAAFIEVGESVTNPSKYYTNNLIGSVLFFDNLRACGVNKIVFSSTAAVYGEPEYIPLSEDAALHPVNPYGWSKMLVEQALQDYDKAYDVKSVSLRYFNAGGAFRSFGENHHPESHLIPLIMDAALTGSPLHVYGSDYNTRDGSCVRDYIHVRDIAEAHILAARYLSCGEMSGCFNLGTGKGFTVLEVLRTVEKVINKSVSYEITGRREGDSAVLVASSEKAHRILGWNKELSSLEAIVESAWEWKKQFPDGYRE